nr:plasmid recombination protein [Treponema sp.]
MEFLTLAKVPEEKPAREKDLHLFDYKRVAHSKDDAGKLNRLLRRINFRISGREAFDRNGYHVGFKCSAKCRPEVAEGHNRRKKNWTEKLEHVEKGGHYEIWLDYKNLDTAYKEIFGEALEEYNAAQRSNRRIKNYLDHIKKDGRKGSMKKNASVDNSRKPVYEFIFQVGKRDNRLDDETSIKILKEFCLEWIPSHYPNIRPIGIYLHADEVTQDPVTKEKLPGAVHVHFDFVPLAHALSKEEQEEEKKWKKELEDKAKKEAESKGEKFNREKFNGQDWQLLRTQKFGKAIANGMKIQSSLTGACCEMGFRTKGKLTAQIQMEEAIRQDLLNLVESYGIKVDRNVDRGQEEVSIQEYKKREDDRK